MPAPPPQPPPQQPPPYQAPPQPPPYPAQPYQAQPYQAQPMAMPPARKGTSPIVWILLIIGGLFVLGILGVVGLGMFALHKARQAGIDPELMRTNPGLAISKLVTAFNPDAEVLNTNDRDGTITIRDRKTGKVVTLSFDQVKNGHFNLRVQEDGKDASLNFGSDVAAKLPSWVPAYPGANVKGGFSATTSGDRGESGTFSFTTSDSADQVRSFYEAQVHHDGTESNTASAYGTVLTLNDSSTRHSIVVTIAGANPTTVGVVYSTK
jgi:hypothetical protein